MSEKRSDTKSDKHFLARPTRRGLFRLAGELVAGATLAGISGEKIIDLTRAVADQQAATLDDAIITHWQVLGMTRLILEKMLKSREECRKNGKEFTYGFEGAGETMSIVERIRPDPQGLDYKIQQELDARELMVMASVLQHAIEQGAGPLIKIIIDKYRDFLTTTVTVPDRTDRPDGPTHAFNFMREIENYGTHADPAMPLEMPREEIYAMIDYCLRDLSIPDAVRTDWVKRTATNPNMQNKR